MVQPTNEQIADGWPLSTTPPSRQRWNWFLNYVMNAVRYFSRRGVVDYDAAETYMDHDMVRGSNGALYRSLLDSNTNHDPTSTSGWWGSVLSPTPSADDSTTKIATTAYVLGQLSAAVPLMAGTGAAGTSTRFARGDHRHPTDSTKANTSGSYPSLSVGFATQAGGVPWSGITSKPTTVSGYGITDAIHSGNIGAQSVAFATSAGRAYPRRSDGAAIDIVWSGQPGQPNWLLGGNDGSSFYVYNPANFSVNFATYSDYSTTRPRGTSDTRIATTQFANPGAHIASIGYQILPSGLILQWGSVTFGNLLTGSYANQLYVSFPLAFPNACLQVPLGKVGGGAGSVPGAFSVSYAGFQMYMEEWAGGISQGGDNAATWLAIGY